MIPVQRPYLGEEELEAVREVFASRWLGLGAFTQEFEAKLRDYLGVKHVIAVNTGTSALHLALDALELRPGDEVIVPSLTFVASVQTIRLAGGTPVFCEIQPDTLTVDVEDVARRVTARTKAIMPVHYAGLACDMDPLLSLARERGVRLVEDAAHAFGTTYRGRKIGTLSDITCFSFDPIKNITCGEGGAVVTNDDAIAARVLPRRILGMTSHSWGRLSGQQRWGFEVIAQGYRYHLSNINAAIGLRQLPRLEEFRTRKLEIVRRYDAAFADLDGLRPLRHSDEMFPFLYVVRVFGGRRDQLMTHLTAQNIGSGIHYIPNHLQPLFAPFRQPLPVTEQVFAEMLTLPLFFEMTDAEVESVIAAVRSFPE